MSHENVKLHRPRLNRPKTISVAAPSTTAAEIVAENTRRAQVRIKNTHASATVYLGPDDTVTSATGYPLIAGAELIDDVSTDAWYAVMASGTGAVAVIEI